LTKRLTAVLGTLAIAITACTAPTAEPATPADLATDATDEAALPSAAASPFPAELAPASSFAPLGALSAPDRPTRAPDRPVPEVAPRIELKPTPRPQPQAAAPRGAPSVGEARSYALRRIGSEQFSCLDRLWTKESGWNPRASNPSSGAYGIPQALPGSKMATVASDWRTNPVTQVRWGLGYISGRYGSACAAWRHSQAHNWY
jgi:hypothetical protein